MVPFRFSDVRGAVAAIARFLARKHKMMGSTEVEAAQIDTVYEHGIVVAAAHAHAHALLSFV